MILTTGRAGKKGSGLTVWVKLTYHAVGMGSVIFGPSLDDSQLPMSDIQR